MSSILDLLKLNLLTYQNMVESHGMKLGIQICLNEINKISNDVVEVVRCKDCKYCTEEGDWCQNEKVRSMCCADGIVEWYFGNNTTAFYPDMDFFCKYGERRDK